MTMTNEQLREILETHGTQASDWPDRARAACLSLLNNDPEAQRLYAQFAALDSLLDSAQVPEIPALEQRILQQVLPPRMRSLLDRILDWLLPAAPFGVQVWRPVLAASLPLVFGILVGNYFSFGVNADNQGFEYWDDELYMLSLNDYTENL